MNQMLNKTSSPPSLTGSNLLDSPMLGAPAQLPVSQPSQTTTPSSTPIKQGTDALSLSDVFVPLESIQPGKIFQINLAVGLLKGDKNNNK